MRALDQLHLGNTAKSIASGCKKSLPIIIYLMLSNPAYAQDFGRYGDPRTPEACSAGRKYNALVSMSGGQRYGYLIESFMNSKYLTESGTALVQAENHYRAWKNYIQRNCPDAL